MKKQLLIYLTFIYALLNGCSAHLYNSSNHDLAIKAEETFKEIQLDKVLTEEYNLMEQILEKELEIVENQTIARRDARIWQIVGANTCKESFEYIDKDILDRIKTLAGSLENAKNIIVINDEIKTTSRNVQSAKSAYLSLKEPNDPIADCDKSADAVNITNPATKLLFNNFLESCKKLNTAKKKYNSLKPNTELSKISNLISDTETKIKTINAKVNSTRDNYKQAREKYEDALKEGDDSEIAEAAEKLKDAIDKIDSKTDKITDFTEKYNFDDFNIISKLAELEEKKKSLDQLLNAFIDYTGEDLLDSSRTDLKIASFVKEFETQINDAKLPQLSVLILESEFINLQIEELEDKLNNAKEKLSLLKEKKHYLTQELSWLVKAYDNIERLEVNCNSTPNKSLYGVIKSNSNEKESKEKEMASYAMIYYNTAWTLCRTKQEEIDYKIIHLKHLSALQDSGNALKQWNTLISIPLAQIVKWEASGIKPDQISALIEALGLGAIAVGVN